jgi:hypothetical protein
MDEKQVTAVADALGGESWQSGGDIWLVLMRRADGKLVVLSDEAVCEYPDDGAFERGQASNSILLR